MKKIIFLLAIIALMQNVYAFDSKSETSNTITVRYPVMKCGFVELPGSIEDKLPLINEGSIKNGGLTNEGSSKLINEGNSQKRFRCNLTWVEKEIKVGNF